MRKIDPKTIELLEKKIAAGRRELQEAYDARGCTDAVVLACSVKLDKLIVRHLKMKMISRVSKGR